MSLPIVQAYIRIRSGTAYVVTQGTMISPSCAQPSEKEIFDFVFEHGKGNANFCARKICVITNNAVLLKYRTKIPFANITKIFAVICEDILMRCDVNSIFDCAGVLTALRAIK